MDANVLSTQEGLSIIQEEIQTLGMDDARRIRKEEAILKVEQALFIQEEFYKEKYGNQWLQLGDKSTNFFHLEASVAASQKQITHMMINDTMVEEESLIASHMEQYFK